MENKSVLPFYGDESDLDRMLPFLRSRPTGATVAEIERVLDKKCADPRKFDYYDLVGLFSRNDGRFRLTNIGLRFIDGTESERREIIRERLRGYAPYQMILEWAFHRQCLSLDTDKASHQWVDTLPDIDFSNLNRTSAAPVTFFKLCGLAGLGNFVLGRRGAKSRFEFNPAELKAYFEADGSSTVEPSPAAGQVPSEIREVRQVGVSSSPPPTKTVSVSESGFKFAIPVAGRIAYLIWESATMSPEEWEKIKRVGDAMFGE